MSFSREFATALYSIATESQNQKDYLEALKLVDGIFRENPEYIDMLESPAVDKEDKWKCLEEAFNGRVPAFVLSYIGLMSDKGHIRSFGESVKVFDELYKTDNNIKTAVVESAVELSEDQKKELITKLETMTGAVVEAEYKILPELLGGFRVDIDGEIIDGSLRHRLAEIKEKMNQ